MDAISYTAARTNLAKTMEQVCEDHSPVIITQSKSPSVVIMSLEDYEALQESAYLLREPFQGVGKPEPPQTLPRWLLVPSN